MIVRPEWAPERPAAQNRHAISFASEKQDEMIARNG